MESIYSKFERNKMEIARVTSHALVELWRVYYREIEKKVAVKNLAEGWQD